MNYCYFNGTILPLEETCISPNDLGVLRGYGIFDFMIARGERGVFARAHYDRLVMSSESLGMKFRLTFDEWMKNVARLGEKNAFDWFEVRTMVTGGPSMDGFTPESEKETTLMLCAQHDILPRKLYQTGVGVVSAEHKREMPYIKTTQYVFPIKNLLVRKSHNAIETLYVYNSKVLECSTSNFFLVKNNTLVTAREGVLKGTVRNAIIEFAKELGIEVEEREVDCAEIYDASEAFLTGSKKHVLPVVTVDDTTIGNKTPGLITRKLMEKYWTVLT